MQPTAAATVIPLIDGIDMKINNSEVIQFFKGNHETLQKYKKVLTTNLETIKKNAAKEAAALNKKVRGKIEIEKRKVAKLEEEKRSSEQRNTELLKREEVKIEEVKKLNTVVKTLTIEKDALEKTVEGLKKSNIASITSEITSERDEALRELRILRRDIAYQNDTIQRRDNELKEERQKFRDLKRVGTPTSEGSNKKRKV